jgi:hypothetical protein
MDTKKRESLDELLRTELYFGIPESGDMGDKIALISLICYLTNALKQKKPGITHYEVIRLCTKSIGITDDIVEKLSLLCNWFSIGCTKFPDLGMKAKDMPDKIKDLILNILPF